MVQFDEFAVIPRMHTQTLTHSPERILYERIRKIENKNPEYFLSILYLYHLDFVYF